MKNFCTILQVNFLLINIDFSVVFSDDFEKLSIAICATKRGLELFDEYCIGTIFSTDLIIFF